MRKLIDIFIRCNQKCSRWFDLLLPKSMCIDGNRTFIDSIAKSHLSESVTIYDVGGGKNPLLKLSDKEQYRLHYIGLDIDADELSNAPLGIYDEVISADISQYSGRGDGDIIICQALLEHVKDVESAFKSLSSMLKPGGLLLIFVPSRNALFARINLLLSEKIKRAMLFFIFPTTKHDQGFPSYYNKCTPGEFNQLAKENKLLVTEKYLYWMSAYFMFFLPFHIAWRFWQGIMRLLFNDQAAETFTMVMKKEALS